MGPFVSEAQLADGDAATSRSASRKARALVTGGQPLTAGAHARGFFHEPTVFGDVDPKMRIAQEEIFGPVVSVMRCHDLDEAIAIGNGVAVRPVGVNLHARRQQGVRAPCATCTPGSST